MPMLRLVGQSCNRSVRLCTMAHRGTSTVLSRMGVVHSVEEEDVKDFMDVLEKSGCAERLAQMTFEKCEIKVGCARALADLICKNAFSELKKLRIFRDRSVTDAGVTVLVEALQKSKHTF